jgi:TP901 family phage tail tape measure protein
MATTAKLNVVFGADLKDFQKGMAQAQRGLADFGKKMESIGRNLTRLVTAPIVALGGASVKAFSDFDDAITQSTAIMSGVTAEMRSQMELTARTISKTLAISSTDAANAYYFLASAGLDANQSIAALPQVAKFAQAGMFDMSRATDLATDAQSALGLSVKDATQNLKNLTRVTDVLVKANTIANASVEQFGEALTTRAGAALRLVNKSMEEGVAVLAVFADQGVKGAEAGGRLDIVLRDLQNASLKNRDLFNQLGISVFDSSGNMNNLADIVEYMERAFKGLSDEQLRSTLSLLGFTDRSIAATASLLGFSNNIRDYESKLKSAGGTTEIVASKQMQSFKNQVELTRNSLVNMSQRIGEVISEAILPLIKRVKDLADNLSSMDKELLKTYVTYGLLAAAIPIAMVAISKFIGVIALLMTPLALKITALLAVGAAITMLILNAKALSERFDYYFGLSKTIVKDMVDETIPALGKLIDTYDELTTSIRNFSKDILEGTYKKILLNVTLIKLSLKSLAEFIDDKFGQGQPNILNIQQDENAFEFIVNMFKKGIDGVKEKVAEMGDPDFQNPLIGFGDAMDIISSKIQNAVARLKDLLFVGQGAGGLNTIEETFKNTEKAATNLSQRVSEFSNHAYVGFNRVEAAAAELPDAIVESEVALEILQPIVDNFVHSFGAGMANVVLQGENLVDTLKNIGKLLASAVIQKGLQLLLSGGLASAGSGFFGSGGGLLGTLLRSGGGRVNAGQPYMTGEIGSELFIPSTNGSIISHRQLQGLGGSAQPVTVNVNVTGKISGRDLVLLVDNNRRTFS